MQMPYVMQRTSLRRASRWSLRIKGYSNRLNQLALANLHKSKTWSRSSHRRRKRLQTWFKESMQVQAAVSTAPKISCPFLTLNASLCLS